MRSNSSNRVTRELTPEEVENLRQKRALIATELPDLVARDQMRKEAHDEPTLSGEVRRAVHASELTLASLAASAGITSVQLDEFLTGERTLRSDVLDRLAAALGFHFHIPR